MSTTLDMLQQLYPNELYITLEDARRDWFSAYSSCKSLLRAIRAGRVHLQVSRECDSRKAPTVVYLNNLAGYLDRHSITQQAGTPAAIKSTGAQHHDHRQIA